MTDLDPAVVERVHEAIVDALEQAAFWGEWEYDPELTGLGAALETADEILEAAAGYAELQAERDELREALQKCGGVIYAYLRTKIGGWTKWETEASSALDKAEAALAQHQEER